MSKYWLNSPKISAVCCFVSASSTRIAIWPLPHQAGVVVRRAIAELGGTMPENLPTAESIKKLERKEKKRLTAPKAQADENK